MDVMQQKVVSREYILSALKNRAASFGLQWDDEGDKNEQASSSEQNENSIDIPGESEYKGTEGYSE